MKSQLGNNFDGYISGNRNTFIYELDENYIITNVTFAIKNIYGISAEEAIGKSAFEVFTLVNNKKMKSHLKPLSNIYCDVLETEILPKNKKKLRVQDIVFFLRDADKFIGIKGIVNDISSRQNVKLSSTEDISKLDGDFGKLVGYWDVDYKKNSLFWNKNFFRILELKPNSMLPAIKTYLPFIFPVDKETVNFAFIDAVKNEKPININHRIKLKNGNIKYVNLQGLTDYDENGNPVKSIGVLMEISKKDFNKENILTNKFKLENTIDEKLYKSDLSEEDYKILAEKTSTLIVRLNRNFRFVYRNPIASFRLGVIVGELLGKTIYELDFTDEEKNIWIKLLNSVFTEKKEKNFVIKLSNNLWIDWTIVPELGVNGKVEFLLLFGHDITERKKIEEIIAESLKKERETNKLISNFIRTLSHEARSPLAAIALSTEILELYQDKLNEKQRSNHFRSIGRAIDNLTSMINEIITLNEIKNQRILRNIKKINIINFCKNLIKEIKTSFEKTPKLHFECKLKFNEINTDRTLLSRILTNLVSNAIKYTDNNKNIFFTLKSNQGKIIFEIEDEGIGIPENQLTKIFESFRRGENVKNIPGAGLGLNIAEQSAELLGGRIEVKSKIGKGSIFRFIMPIDGSKNL